MNEHADRIMRVATSFVEQGDGSPFSQVMAPEQDIVDVFWIGHPQPDPMWGTYIGDFLHNARSALDHLVFWMIEHTTGTRSQRSAFPIASASGDWRNDVSERDRDRRGPSPLDGLAPHLIAWIESVQPF